MVHHFRNNCKVCHLAGTVASVLERRECKVPFNAAIRAIFNGKYNVEGGEEELYNDGQGDQEKIKGVVGGDDRS